MFALVKLSNGTYYVCSSSDIYARRGNNCVLKKPKSRTKTCIVAINGMYVFIILLYINTIML